MINQFGSNVLYYNDVSDNEFIIEVRVMQSAFKKVTLSGALLSVADALVTIIQKLELSTCIGNGLRLKYFLFRESEYTGDGWEILPEITPEGIPVTLNDYGVGNGSKLEMGAIILKDTPVEITEELQPIYEI